jgi:hypothetical protein
VDINEIFASAKKKITESKVEPKKEQPKVVPKPEKKQEDPAPVIEAIYARARDLKGAHNTWSREIQFVMSDKHILQFYWDDKGKIYYHSYIYDPKEHGLSDEFVRNNECYKLIYKNGQIVQVLAPEFIKENPDLYLGTQPQHTDGTPPPPVKKQKRSNKRKSCSSHPTYSGARKPRTDCAECWGLYKEKHPDYEQPDEEI